MRRKLCLLLAVCLSLFILSAHAATQTFSGLFSIDYDETVLFPDVTSYLTGSDSESRWLCMFGAEDYLIDVSMSRVEGWEHLSLTGPGDPMTSWYLEEMLTGGVEHLGNVQVNGVLFCMFRTFDADGEYLMAETVQNGWAISFYAYNDDPVQKTDDRLSEALTVLLKTFKPAR